MEVKSCVREFIGAVSQYNNKKSNGNLLYLQKQLEILHGLVNRTACRRFFNRRHMLAIECITCLVDIVGNVHNKCAPKCVAVLNCIAQEDDMREMLHSTYNICPSVADLLMSYEGTSADSLSSECLRLLQKITYGYHISIQERFMEQLLKYLINEMILSTNSLTEPCLGLLANLCRDNYPVQMFMRSRDNSKRLYKVLISHFCDQNLTMAVYAFSIFASVCLPEKIADEVFDAENINQSLQMMFNILVNSDSGMTLVYAVDLFQDLLKHHKFQESLQRYAHLQECITYTLKLISRGTAETMAKLFGLLLSFCSVTGVYSMMCKAMFNIQTSVGAGYYQQMLAGPVTLVSEPLFATVHWAMQSVETSKLASLAALDLLTEVYEEVLYSGKRDQWCLHMDLLLPVLVNLLKISVTGEINIRNKCLKIVKAVRFLTVLCAEDDLKAAVSDLMDVNIMTNLLEYQFSHNQLLLLKKTASCKGQNDWSMVGVEVVLVCLELMSKLKKHVSGMQSFFTDLIQDSRLVPFLAAGVTSGDRSVVQLALKLVCFGSTLDEFPDIVLGDAVAAMNAQKGETRCSEAEHRQDTPAPFQHYDVQSLLSSKETLSTSGSRKVQEPNESSSFDASIQMIIEKMQSTLEVKDMRASEIIAIYEHRIQSLQTNAEHLQNLMETKALALTQADRLLQQNRAREAHFEAETHTLKSLLHEAERKNDDYLEQLNSKNLAFENLRNDFDLQKMEVERLEAKASELEVLKNEHATLLEKFQIQERTFSSLKQEHRTLREMHEILQKHHECLKHQHDITTEQLSVLEDESKQLARILKDKENKLQEVTKSLLAIEERHKKTLRDKDETEKDKEALELAVNKLRSDIGRAEQLRRELQQKVSACCIVGFSHTVV
ncbi:protein CIP2A homolog [Gigantopelta aegis]|uniref:protein CIP2A homolog n=1 Tax=Gigantopelta aegis TaxID=1735272 RepID=UPI001B88945F|nr:protein CIP2A homolog [Gigantopelta aegis]